jgi:hypothetical protein
MAYTSVTDVRAITNLLADEITDTEIAALIDFASSQVNADIGVQIKGEEYPTLVGAMDGTNTEFRTSHYPLGDSNNDYLVNASDITVWKRTNIDLYYSKVTVASIDDEVGKVVLAVAPAQTDKIKVDYMWFPVRVNNILLRRAAAELTAYMCYLKLNLMDMTSYRLGKLQINRAARFPVLGSFLDRYYSTLKSIRGQGGGMVRRVDWDMMDQMTEDIVEVLPGAWYPGSEGFDQKGARK